MLKEKELTDAKVFGSELTPRLASLLGEMRGWFEVQRSIGRVTPNNPATTSDIIDAFRNKEISISAVDVRALINALRRRNFPIASSGDGYFLAKTWEEIAATIMQLNHRVQAICAARDGIIRAFGDERGQWPLL